MDARLMLAGELLIGFAVPWYIWVTASLFNQRQEIALLRQMLQAMQKIQPVNKRSPI